jgi:hypothetical protein
MSRPGNPGLIDWPAVRAQLLRCEAHYRPWEIDRMTLAEVAEVLEAHAEQRPGSRDADEHRGLDAESYVRWWRGLTPGQRLAIKRRKVDW